MKSILAILVFLLFNFSGFAQQIINVFDAFTLEPIDTFDFKIISGKIGSAEKVRNEVAIRRSQKRCI